MLLKKIESKDKVIWVTEPNAKPEILIQVKDAWLIGAVNRLVELGDYEGIKKAAKESGEVMFDKLIPRKEKPEKWTPMRWVELTTEYIHNPAGAGITFSEISDSGVTAHYFKCSRPELSSTNPHAACYFHYGIWRAIWQKAFPNGDLIIKGIMSFGCPTCDFKFVVNATDSNRKKMGSYIAKITKKYKSKTTPTNFWNTED